MKTFLHGVALGMAVIGLAGCNSLTGDAVDTLRIAVTGPEPVATVERVNAVDAPVLLAELGVAEAMLVSPAQQATGVVEWHGVTEMLLTHEGRVTQSAGLSADVIAPLLPDDPLVVGLHTLADGHAVTRLVDYPALYQTGLRQQAQYQRRKVESITFMGAKHDLLRVDEKIHMPELGFKATNKYWVEPDTGLVRYSEQYLAPDMPPLRLTLVKTSAPTDPNTEAAQQP